MTTRKYSSRSQQTTLASNLTDSATTCTVVSGSALLGGASVPSGTTFTVVIDPDTALEEIVDVTVVSTNTLTIVRGVENAGTGQAHSAGAAVRHMAIGRDFREANLHIEATGGYNDGTGAHAMHGIASGEGDVVGTLKSQTLTNKTLTSPTISNPTITGTPGVGTSIVFEGATADDHETTLTVVDPTQDNTITLPNTTGTVVLATATQTLTNKTMGDALNAGGFKITNLATPTLASDAVRKDFADAQVAAAATSAASAATSAASAATSASSALTSANSASASQTAAATSAASAATSASTMAASVTAAASSATAAASSATAASTSATSAAASATAAATSATSAAASATAAATSATSAAASATTAANSVATIAASASAAATSAASASTSASSALTSQSAAATSAASASTSASSALTSATSAATSYDDFDDRYLGAKATPPTVDNDGNALLTGALYWNTSVNKMYVWSGTAWGEISSSADIIAYKYTVTGGATSVSGADDNGLTLTYTVGKEQVYINGVLQVRGSDYTATTGSSITGISAMIASDIVTVLAFTSFSVSDTYTQAQADAKFVQQSNNFFAGKNKIINGDFGINQRAFTSTTTSGTYGFDRWVMTTVGDGTTTYTPQNFTAGAAPVVGYEGKSFAELVTASQTTITTASFLSQRIENVRTFAGQTITVSFWAKANSGTPKIAVEITQNFGSGGSPSTSVNTYAGQVTISTSWARYSVSVAVPSISGKTIGTNENSICQMNLWVSAGSNFDARTGSIGIQTNTFQFWGVQVEAGSIATPFQTATGTIQGELAACQRYYFRNTSGNTTQILMPSGSLATTTQARGFMSFPVPMRVSPTSIDGSNLAFLKADGSQVAMSSVTIYLTSPAAGAIYGTVALSVAGEVGSIVSDAATGYIGFSAEL
jgi:hypothetical protein